MHLNRHALLAPLLLVLLATGCSERPPSTPSSSSTTTPLTGSLTGTWVGTMSKTGETPASVRYEITDNNGQLSGNAFDLEPGRNQYIKTGTLTGTRTGTSAQWSTTGGDAITGTLSGTTFTGTLVVTDNTYDQALTAQLSLQLSSCVPESDVAFCSRLGAACGQFLGTDNCGVRRVVASCGTCSGGALACNQNQCPPPECAGTTSGTCTAESGCAWVTGCCGGICLAPGETCPITCPPPEG